MFWCSYRHSSIFLRGLEQMSNICIIQRASELKYECSNRCFMLALWSFGGILTLRQQFLIFSSYNELMNIAFKHVYSPYIVFRLSFATALHVLLAMIWTEIDALCSSSIFLLQIMKTNPMRESEGWARALVGPRAVYSVLLIRPLQIPDAPVGKVWYNLL